MPVPYDNTKPRITAVEADLVGVHSSIAEIHSELDGIDLSGFVTFTNLTDALTDKVDVVVFEGFASDTNDAIAAKADILSVTMLEAEVDGKANAVHTHVISDVTGLQTALDTKATTTALTTGLAGKANTSHTHVIADVTGLQTALNAKTDQSYTDSIAGSFSTALSTKLPLAGGTLTGTLNFSNSGTYFGSIQAGSGSSLYLDAPNGLTLNANTGINGALYVTGIINGNGSGLTNLTKAQVGLSNVANVAALPLTGGTLTGSVNAVDIDLANAKTISGTFTTGVAVGLLQVWSNNVCYFGPYSGPSGATTGSQLQIRYGSGNDQGHAIVIDGPTSTFDAQALDATFRNVSVQSNLYLTEGLVGCAGVNGLTGLYVVGYEDNETVSLYWRDMEAITVSSYNVAFNLDVSMGFVFASYIQANGLECLGSAYFGSSVSVDSSLYVGGAGEVYDNLKVGQQKVLIGQDNTGTYGGIWFGGGVTTPTTSNYAFLYDAGSSGTLLNAPSGGYFQMRIGNDYSNGLTFSASKNLVIGGAYNEAGYAKLDVRGGAYITGSANIVGDVVTSGKFVGSAAGLTHIPAIRGIVLEAPTATENVTLFHTGSASLPLTSISAVLAGGTSPSVTWSLRYSYDRSATGTEIVTGGTTTTSTTTADTVTTFTVATIPSGSWVWLKTTACSGSPASLALTIRTA